MKSVSLLTACLILALVAGLFYAHKISDSAPSYDIDFAPGDELEKNESKYSGGKPKNIIVFIADGMGFGHLSLAMITQQSKNTPSVWQEFDVKGWHDARSIYGPLTDSEASATAIATGVSTHIGFIGLDKDGNTLKNIFEDASEQQYATAIVTDSYIWDGTPAAFIAHTKKAYDARDILKQMASSELDLLFGELRNVRGGNAPKKDEVLNILGTRFRLLDKSLELPGSDSISMPIASLFAADQVQDLHSSPNLTQLTDVALKYLSAQNKPFVLLVESEEMDSASHGNDQERLIKGLKSIQQTLSLVLNFSQKQKQTLVLFTADHETGGLAVLSDSTKYPKLQISWSTKVHTAAVVPLFAKGPGAGYFADVHRNWEIGKRLKSLISQDNGLNQ